MPSSYGTRLTFHRQQRGLSLRQLGDMLGISFSTLARIERQEGAPSRHTRLLLEQWFDPEGAHPKCNCPQCAFPREHLYRSLEARIALLEERIAHLELLS